MKIGLEDVAYLIFMCLVMGLGSFLFFSKTYIAKSTKRQRSLGRETVARYQETRFYLYFVKAFGLSMMFASGWLLCTFFKVLLYIAHT